jgi:hypothetical protein
MTRGLVSFTLDDGDTLPVRDENLRRVYETLWELAKEPGAVSTAALLMDARRLDPFVRKPISLTAPQSAVLRKATAMLDRTDS